MVSSKKNSTIALLRCFGIPNDCESFEKCAKLIYELCVWHTHLSVNIETLWGVKINLKKKTGQNIGMTNNGIVKLNAIYLHLLLSLLNWMAFFLFILSTFANKSLRMSMAPHSFQCKCQIGDKKKLVRFCVSPSLFLSFCFCFC